MSVRSQERNGRPKGTRSLSFVSLRSLRHSPCHWCAVSELSSAPARRSWWRGPMARTNRPYNLQLYVPPLHPEVLPGSTGEAGVTQAAYT